MDNKGTPQGAEPAGERAIRVEGPEPAQTRVRVTGPAEAESEARARVDAGQDEEFVDDDEAPGAARRL